MGNPRFEQFRTTEWSLIVAAGSHIEPASREALERLCAVYWNPVYTFIRHWGLPASDAEDLTQDFFCGVIEKRTFSAAVRERGRFRSFLLTALKNFLVNRRKRSLAVKRGGHARIVTASDDAAAWQSAPASIDRSSPETMFARRWALATIAETLKRLRDEAGRDTRRFEQLSGFIVGGSPAASYREVSAELGMSEAAVKTAVHRLRKRFALVLREQIGRTVEDPSQIDDEIRYLFTALGPPNDP